MNNEIDNERDYVEDEEIKNADDVIEEHLDDSEEGSAEELPKEKPLLNASRIFSFGTYKPLYDIQCIDEERKIWKGRPIVEPLDKKVPAAMVEKMRQSWIFFHRNYDDRNDWDRFYREHEIVDESIAGQKVLLVPKEKLLFAYEPPPGAGIIIPMAGVIGRG